MNKKSILIINGANLNILGNRENNIYGSLSFEKYFAILQKRFRNIDLEYKQSNIEGEIVNFLQNAQSDGIILNAGGYTHTSVVIRDAIKAINIPVIEVHISNIFAREEFRHQSLIAPVCIGSIIGFGLKGYDLAIEAFVKED